MTPRPRTWLALLDRWLFLLLALGLVCAAWGWARANIQTDSIDFYVILERLTGETQPIIPDSPFLDQRSPGYPLLSLPLYYGLHLAAGRIEPQILHPGPPAPDGPGASSEQMSMPPQPLLFREVFFKNFDLRPRGGWYRWENIGALILTSLFFFLAGLAACGKSLSLLYPELNGWSLAGLVVVTSPVFLHNLINTPAYATLCAFGLSSLGLYFGLRGWKMGGTRSQLGAGLFAGLLVLTRLEMALPILVLAAGLAAARTWKFLRNFALGGLPSLLLLAGYNASQFGSPLHAGMLKGNMSVVRFDAAYFFASLAAPGAGILFWSPLIVLGVIGLWLMPGRGYKLLGAAALALIGLVAVRVPVMYFCIGQGAQVINGVSVGCPADMRQMLELIRMDANRYVVPLAPLGVLGLRGLLGWFGGLRARGKEH
jgi:hypothetical protein